MSNVGQALLSITGFAVGSLFGAPQLGFMLGSLAGNSLFPTKLPGQTGPRLSDTRTTTATVGGPVPETMGTDAVAGTVIWMGPLNEISNTEEVGGKGAPSQEVTTYSYTQSIAIGLCRGPMGAVLRIWENGALVYDARAQQDGETDAAYQARIDASDEYAQGFTLYLGTEDQLPDPTIEADKGVGNVPAFRGLVYIVFHDRQLKEEQALRHPSFKFEVSETGALQCTDNIVLANEVLYDWNLAANPTNSLNTNTFEVINTGNHQGWSQATSYPYSLPGTYDTLNSALNALNNAMDGRSYGVLLGYSCPSLMASTKEGWLAGAEPPGETVDGAEPPYIYLHYSPVQPLAVLGYQAAIDASVAGYVWLENNGIFDGLVYMDGYAATGFGPYGMIFADGGTSGAVTFPYMNAVTMNAGRYGWYLGVAAIKVTRSPGPPAEGQLVSGSYKVLQKFDSGTVPNKKPLGPVLEVGDPADTQAYWEAAYALAVANGEMAAGLTYPADYPQTQSFAYLVTEQDCVASDGTVTLAQIVERICARCGLQDNEIDASDLDGVIVAGYTIASVMTGRDAIEPLRNVGYFDVIESEGKLKFVARGGAAVRTIEPWQLGAGDGQPGMAVETQDMDNTDLPRMVRVHYKAISRDYEAGEQLSPSRTTSDAVHVSDVEIAVAMTDEMAAQIAEVIWADAWNARRVHKFALSAMHLDLDPADPILVPIDGQYRRVRIAEIDDAIGMVRQITAVPDDDGSYSPTSVADTPERAPSAIRILSPSVLLMLDLPPLRGAQDDDAGFYLVGYPSQDTTWPGVVVHRSTDGGATYTELLGITNIPTMGTVPAAIPDGDVGTWDYETTITLTLARGAGLESRTAAEVLEGANAIAVGADGRWEIIQFQTVEQLSATSYRISDLLRGRRGTEYLTGTHQAGDTWVLISGLGVVRVPLDDADINATYLYKPVTIGATFGSATDQPIAGSGQALEPFGPVQIQYGEYGSPSVDYIQWTRRDRIGETFTEAELINSEADESYEVDVYDATDTLVFSGSTTEPRIRFAPLTNLGALAIGITFVRSFQGYLLGILASDRNSFRRYVIQGSPAGYVDGAALGQTIYQMAVDDVNGVVYVGGLNPPAAGQLARYAAADLTTATHTLSGSRYGVAYDGTYVWATFETALTRHDPDDLTLLNTYTIGVAMSHVHPVGGRLFIVDRGADQVLVFDTTSLTVTHTVTIPDMPIGLAVAGDLLFVRTGGALLVYNWTTGTLITNDTVGWTDDTNGWGAEHVFDDGVAYVYAVRGVTNSVAVYDRATGALARDIEFAENINQAQGLIDGYLLVGTVSATYMLAATGTGTFTVKVYQMSDVVGRGNPGTGTITIEA